MVTEILDLGELKLTLTAESRNVEDLGKPYMDWLCCGLEVTVPRFHGTTPWYADPDELLSLADDLDNLHGSIKKGASCTFESMEPNLKLVLRSNAAGVIQVEYRVAGDPAIGPWLSGEVQIDQTYLPGLARGIRSFVKAATRAL